VMSLERRKAGADPSSPATLTWALSGASFARMRSMYLTTVVVMGWGSGLSLGGGWRKRHRLSIAKTGPIIQAEGG